MSKVTPGTWYAADGFDGGSLGMVKRFEDKKLIASCYGDHPDCEPDDVMAANARLIAAAPDLLAALDAAETMLRCLPYTSTNANGTKPNMDTPTALRLVRAAIEKATK